MGRIRAAITTSVLGAVLAVAPAVGVSAADQAAAQCASSSSTLLAVSASGRPVWFYGDEIGEPAMAVLWDYASTHGPHDFGRMIGAAHDWFRACRYPGVGLGTGSGYSWHDRNVVLWMWADEVDLAVARQSILDLVAGLMPVAAPSVSTTVPAPTPTPMTTTAAPSVLVSASALPAPVIAPSAPKQKPTGTKPKATAKSKKVSRAARPGAATRLTSTPRHRGACTSPRTLPCSSGSARPS